MVIASELKGDFERTLLTGGYNLLLGAGISLGSKNSEGIALRSTEDLRTQLCTRLGVPQGTAFNRVYQLLGEAERDHELTRPYSGCVPHVSLAPLSRFIWRRLFTFNIDDVIEAHYEKARAPKQELYLTNYDAPFEPTPEKAVLQAIHLHGSVRAPNAGYVFSVTEYARVMRELNPWMHLLSEILSTEPFVVSGTSLNEPDVEYYLSHRTAVTPRRDRGPSLLVEPYPTRVTRSDCNRYGLILVEATFGDFLAWLASEWPNPPSVAELTIPDLADVFPEDISKTSLLRFFSDFELVAASDQALPATPSAFMYGRAPEWKEIDQHYDVERFDNQHVADLLVKTAGDVTRPAITVILDEAGTGKTTCLKRVAHDYAAAGKVVLAARTMSRIDVDAAVECLSRTRVDILLVVDGIADHIEQVAEILDADSLPDSVTIIGAERRYRQEYIDVILGEGARRTHQLRDLSVGEYRQLIERYQSFGLLGATEAIRTPDQFASKLRGDSVAVAICRILNDFKPFDQICATLWRDADVDHRIPFLCVALAQHCHRAGIRYSVLQKIVGTSVAVRDMFGPGVPLSLTTDDTVDDFVVPANPIVAERLLQRSTTQERRSLGEAFRHIARAIAPHVNRKAIMRRSPEARLAVRLFDADKVVRPLLRDGAESFYIDVKSEWEWNSRYWEQRALLAAGNDIQTAIGYARHAVAVEEHAFPMTTLGKILLRAMETTSGPADDIYREASEWLRKAIDAEARRSRTTIHPYTTLLGGTARYLELGGVLTRDQQAWLSEYAYSASTLFENDRMVREAVLRLRSRMPTLVW